MGQSPDLARPMPLLSAKNIIQADFAAHTNGIAVDRSGYIYLVGDTNSNTLPTTTDSYQQTFGGSDYCDRDGCAEGDGFIVKLDPSGQNVVAATYLGGPHDDTVYGIAFDSAGNVIVTAYLSTLQIPAPSGALFTTGQWHILKFDSGLSHLLAATAWPMAPSLQVDAQDRILLSGWTPYPAGFGTVVPEHVSTPAPCTQLDWCSYAARLNASMTKIEASTFLEGTIDGFTPADDGGYWMAGRAKPSSFPMDDGRFDRRHAGSSDTYAHFIAHFDRDLNFTSSAIAMRAISELSPPPYRAVNTYHLKSDGTLILAGFASAGIPVTENAPMPRPYAGGDTAFVSVTSSRGELEYSTWLGPPNGYAEELAVNTDGTIWVGGKVDQQIGSKYTNSKRLIKLDPSKTGATSISNYLTAGSEVFNQDRYDEHYWDGLLALPDGSLATPIYGQVVSAEPSATYGLYLSRIGVRAQAQLSITTDFPRFIRGNDLSTWRLTVTNPSDEPALASGVRLGFFHVQAGDYTTLMDTPLSEIFHINSSSATQGSCDGTDVITCDFGSIAPHTSVAVTVQGTASASTYTLYDTLGIRADWQDGMGVRYFNVATAQRPSPVPALVDVSIAFGGLPDNVEQGDTVTFNLVLTNHGPDVAKNVDIETPFPLALTPAQRSKGYCSVGSACLVTLGVNETISFPVTTTFGNSGTESLWSGVSVPGSGNTSPNTEVTKTVTIRGELTPLDPPSLSDWLFSKDYNNDESPLLIVRIPPKDGYVALLDGKPYPISMYGGFVALQINQADFKLAPYVTLQICVPDKRCSEVLTIPTPGYQRTPRTSRSQGNGSTPVVSSKLQPRAARLRPAGKR